MKEKGGDDYGAQLSIVSNVHDSIDQRDCVCVCRVVWERGALRGGRGKWPF